MPGVATMLRLSPGAARWALTLGLVGVVWRSTRWAMRWPLWGDEAMLAIQIAVRDWAELAAPLVRGQAAPLGFLWIERAAFCWLGPSELALRAYPFALGLLSLVLFARLAAAVARPRAALLATGIFAVSYYVVRHAVEIKPYGPDLFFALALWVLALRLSRSVGDERVPVRAWLAFAAVAGVAAWCSYPSIFVSAGVLLALGPRLLARGRSPAARLAWSATSLWLLGCFAASFLLVAAGQASSVAEVLATDMWRDSFPPLDRPWRIPAWLLSIHTGSMLAHPVGGAHFGSSASFLLAVAGVSALLLRGAASRRSLALLGAPFALALIAASLGLYPYGGTARTSLYLAPAICIFVGEGARWTIQLLRRRIRAAAATAAGCALLIAIGAIGTLRDVAEPFKEPNDRPGRRAAFALISRVAAEDLVIVENAHLSPPGDPLGYPGRGTSPALGYYLFAHAPGPVWWGVPDRPAVESFDTVWLVLHQTRHAELPAERFADLREALQERFGAPHLERRDIDAGEWLEIRRYQIRDRR